MWWGKPFRITRSLKSSAKAASALNYPNIVTAHDVATEDRTDFIVTEFFPGAARSAI
jgi:hypothetical protein